MDVLLAIILLVGVFTASIWGYKTGKKESTTEVLNHASKRKEAVDSVDGMSPSNRRKLMRKYTRK